MEVVLTCVFPCFTQKWFDLNLSKFAPILVELIFQLSEHFPTLPKSSVFFLSDVVSSVFCNFFIVSLDLSQVFSICFPVLLICFLQFLPNWFFHVFILLVASSKLPRGHRDGQITDFSRFTSATAALAPCTEPHERQNGLNETSLRHSRLRDKVVPQFVS